MRCERNNSTERQGAQRGREKDESRYHESNKRRRRGIMKRQKGNEAKETDELFAFMLFGKEGSDDRMHK